MAELDLNPLTALDVLLSEGSVTGAARRLGLSPLALVAIGDREANHRLSSSGFRLRSPGAGAAEMLLAST